MQIKAAVMTLVWKHIPATAWKTMETLPTPRNIDIKINKRLHTQTHVVGKVSVSAC